MAMGQQGFFPRHAVAAVEIQFPLAKSLVSLVGHGASARLTCPDL